MIKKKLNKKNLNYLEMHPFRLYEHILLEENLVDVLVPRFTSKLAKKLILPKLPNPYIRANLDELGSFLWLNIDGETKVSELINKMKEKFAEKVEPATERVLLFLTQLYKAGFIDFYELNER
ncbi:PqqD family protein [Bacteroidetes/Chlorobi group bacterium MS-B_bin-24]|nr:MAG: PqqD family protein [Bacteroidetes/Chlorobi group bacterium MS-B_bin-24]